MKLSEHQLKRAAQELHTQQVAEQRSSGNDRGLPVLSAGCAGKPWHSSLASVLTERPAQPNFPSSTACHTTVSGLMKARLDMSLLGA